MLKLPNRLAIVLTPAAQKKVKQGHPWIFDQGITRQSDSGANGSLCIIYDHHTRKMIAIGLFDPHSPIRIKVIHQGGAQTIDRSFFEVKINNAFAKRTPLLATDTTAYRLIFGESDGFPGLIADVYDQVLVVKLYSWCWEPYLDTIFELLQKQSGCKVLILRLSRNAQKTASGAYTDGQVVYGSWEAAQSVYFKEYGVQFSANPLRGHKTGHFLDHRENRRRVGELSRGKSVLDVFSYTGGVSVHALVGGATTVTSLDISGPALEQAKKNADLNEFSGEHRTLQGDAFKVMEQLRQQGTSFDVLVIDPPSFAKRAAEVDRAKQSYRSLVHLGASLLKPEGLLLMASCSSRIPAEDFFQLVEEELMKCGKSFVIDDKTLHDIDHPIGFPEAAYLKCGYYQMRP
ncbi:class I SAM-dependent rRNA methyltransferase [Croceiramulus getboli]|nr:class I SAM-dependent rRNA methyltransferase [Flavobacteriaceae bacterium YJPT1-3]